MKLTCIILLLSLSLSACDHGLEPPDFSGTGTIVGTIEYVGPWPAIEELQDLRFVGMRFVPRDTSDFLQLNLMAISGGLKKQVDFDEFRVDEVTTGLYLYSGIAQKFDADLLSWRPVGLYTNDGGIFSVAPNQTTEIHIRVDFNNLPIFPPTQ